MKVYRKTVVATLGALLLLAGAAGSFVMFSQPWRSCPEIDHTSAGCLSTGSNQGLFGVAVLVLMVGMVLLAVSISMRRARLASDAAGPFGSFGSFD